MNIKIQKQIPSGRFLYFAGEGAVSNVKNLNTEVWSYTERVKLESKILCNSVSLYLCVENTFDKAASLLNHFLL